MSFEPGPASQTGDCGTLWAEHFMLPICNIPSPFEARIAVFGRCERWCHVKESSRRIPCPKASTIFPLNGRV